MPRARPGSTTYDGADPEAPEPAWQGASWYGESSGTYWRINPKEYADPRKHGPEYQARSRRVAADMAAATATAAAPAPASAAADAAAAGAPSASARPAAPAGDPGRATSASGGPVGATQAGPAGRDAAGHDAAGRGPASAGGHPAEEGRYPRHGWRSWLRLPFRRRVR